MFKKTKVKNLPSTSNGQEIFVECKRGAKPKNHISTKKVVANGTVVNWEEKLKFYCSFMEDAKTKKLDQKKKELSFVVKEMSKDAKEKKDKKDDKGNIIAKGSINLASFSEQGTIRHESVSLKPEKKVSPTPSLAIKIETNWVKLDNKKLVKKEDAKDIKDDSKSGEVKLGGEEFVLQATDETTETNASHSDDEEEEAENLPEDETDDGKKSSQRNSLKPSEQEPSSGKKNNEDELRYLKERYESEIQDLIKDRDRLEKKIAKLTKEETPVTTNEDNAELEDLKKDNTRLERKVEKLSKELEEKKKELETKNSAPPPTTSSSSSVDKEQIQKLQEEKTKLESKITDLQKQLDSEIKSKSDLQKSLDKVKEDSKVKGKGPDESLQKELDATKRQLDETKKSLEEKTKTLEETKKSSDEWKKANKELLEQLAKQKDQITQLEKEKSQVKSVPAPATSSPATTTSKTQSTTTTAISTEEKKKFEETILNLQTQLDSLTKEKQSLQQTIDSLNQKIQTLEKKVQKNKEKKKKLTKDIETSKKEQETTSTTLNAKIAELETTLRSKQEQITVLTKEKTDTKSSKSSKQEDLLNKQLAEQKRDYTEKLQASDKKINELQSKIQSLESKSPNTSSSNESVKTQLEEVKKELDSTKKRLQEETKNRETIEKELSVMKKNQTDKAKDTQNKEKEEEEELKRKIALMRQEKEVEALKKRATVLQREIDERKLIESTIYAGEAEYDEEKGIAINVSVITSNLITWNSFDPPNEELLSNIIGSIKKSFTKSAYDSEMLAYWLSLTTSLFQVLKKDLSESVNVDDQALAQHFENADPVEQLDPIPKFFVELLSLAFDIYSVLLINLYSQLDHILLPSVLDNADGSHSTKTPDKKRGSQSHDYTNILGDILKLLKKNFILESVQQHFLRQIFYFMDAQLFNALLRKPELYTASSGFQIKIAISQVETLMGKVDKQLGSLAHQELNHIREVANLLVMDKSIVSDESTVSQIFSHMNIAQIRHILEKFRPDDVAPEVVSPTVKRALEEAVKRNPSLQVQLDPMSIKKVNLLHGK